MGHYASLDIARAWLGAKGYANDMVAVVDAQKRVARKVLEVDLIFVPCTVVAEGVSTKDAPKVLRVPHSFVYLMEEAVFVLMKVAEKRTRGMDFVKHMGVAVAALNPTAVRRHGKASTCARLISKKSSNRRDC